MQHVRRDQSISEVYYVCISAFDCIDVYYIENYVYPSNGTSRIRKIVLLF